MLKSLWVCTDVAIYHDDESKCVCSEGSFFGEAPLLWNIPQPITVFTLMDCEFFTLSKADFDRIFHVGADLVQRYFCVNLMTVRCCVFCSCIRM
jgi:CRP-like cAMP-binding protein